MIRSLALVLALALPLAAQLPSNGNEAVPRDPRPLEHEDTATWRETSETAISPAGDWITWREVPANGDDGDLVIASRIRKLTHRIPRGRGARFSADERHLVCLQNAPRAERRAAKDPMLAAKDRPKAPGSRLVILDLATGEQRVLENAERFLMGERGGDHLAVFLKSAPKSPDAEKKKDDAAPKAAAAKTKTPSVPESLSARRRREAKRKGKFVRLVSLVDPTFSHDLKDVGELRFARDGRWLALARETRPGKSDGVSVLVFDDAKTSLEEREIASGEGRYRQLTINRAGDRLAFLSDRDDRDAKEPAFALYGWKSGESRAAILASAATPRLPRGWCPSVHQTPRFSRNGDRLYFGMAPAPRAAPDPVHPEDAFELDVWHWRDPVIKPEQRQRKTAELRRTWLAVCWLRDGEVRPLGREHIPSIRIDEAARAGTLLGRDDSPYVWQRSFDADVPADFYAIDVRTGESRLLAKKRRGRYAPSPGGTWAAGWDGVARTWRAFHLSTGREVDLGRAISAELADARHDSPRLPSPANGGLLGWLANDAGALISDGLDLWLVDPARPDMARRITAGLGRGRQWRFRPLALDAETRALDPDRPLLLEVFDQVTKRSGFAEVRLDSLAPPRVLIMEEAAFGRPRRARDAEVLLYTRETFRDFPDLWTSAPDFGDRRRISDVNPQRAGFTWGSARLVRWPHPKREGVTLEGLLYVPDGFDPDRKEAYPLLTYFYERNADNLFRHDPPNPHRSIIRKSFYVSRGYCVFVPDIIYEEGYPGRSSYDCVLSGVDHVVDQGFVDPKRIGVQGHSWGGYQIAWLVTRTNRFACAIAGAPVANMTSAYGGVRWGTGMSRQFQYEKTQSRIGRTPWDEGGLDLYLENSPFVRADRVKTPLLMLHNDRDGAVPWYQGIEMFMALRRLEKPVWMLNYRGQPHWVTTWPTKSDYARRMQQFLDHHLMGAPLPRWLATGIPATENDRTRGFETATDEGKAPVRAGER